MFLAAVANSWATLVVSPQVMATVLGTKVPVLSHCLKLIFLEFLQHYILSFNTLTDDPNLKPALHNNDM